MNMTNNDETDKMLDQILLEIANYWVDCYENAEAPSLTRISRIINKYKKNKDVEDS